jgi:DNA-binding transcriptional regulator GbsR (MarR family)
MREMHDLIEMLMRWYDEVQHMDTQTLSQLMRMGSKVGKLLEFTKAKRPPPANKKG